MPAVADYVGPKWPPPLEAYDYLARLTWRDRAWEGLRRNSHYQADARHHTPKAINRQQIGSRALLTLMQEPNTPAEAWALCCFRQPSSQCAGRASRLDARRWGISVSGTRRAGRRHRHARLKCILPRLALPRAYLGRQQWSPARRVAC